MRTIILLFLFIGLAACQTNKSFTQPDISDYSPNNWQAANLQADSAEANHTWYQDYANPEIDGLINSALLNNIDLQKQGLTVKVAQKQLTNQEAQLWPTLSLNFNASRNQTASNLSSSNSASLSASYEIDLWGKLNAQAKAQAYQYLSSQAQYQQSQQALVAQVFALYTQIVEANTLLELFQQRASNSEQNQQVIESGYQKGLNDALDVYLARNELNSDRAKVTTQQQAKDALVRSLETLLGVYPKSALTFAQSLPSISTQLTAGIPADLAKNSPALKVAWLQLLQANELVAVAHKKRFPSFTLTSSLGKASENISELFSSDLIWSVVGSIVAPIFNAGTLANNEDIAALTAQQAELDYLATLRDIFLTIENALFLEANLNSRINDFSAAKDNAIAAEKLSFEQYQKGLVEYTTVLEAQTRAVDAQSALIQLKQDLFINRINLHLALGSGFNFLTSESMDSNE